MKKTLLSSSLLGLLSSAFMKNLFPKPLKGELLVEENPESSSCILYFNEEYHDKLDAKIKEHYYKGAFANSNSEREWMDLMNEINAADNTSDDTSELKSYWLSIDPEAEKKPEIEIDNNKLSEILSSERPTKSDWIGKIMVDLSDDIKAVYVGHLISWNHNGYVSIGRIIEDSLFSSSVQLVPMLQIFNKYQVEIDSLKIMNLINPENINATVYLKK